MAKRTAFHKERIDGAPDDVARLWQTLQWLAAEALRSDRLVEVTRTIQDLIDRLIHDEDMPEPTPQHRDRTENVA